MGRLISDTQGRISFRAYPIPLHVGEEDLLKILNLSDVDTLHYEVHYLSRYVDEEYLFKVGLYIQTGRSHARMLKKFAKVPEGDPQASKKKRVEEILTVTNKSQHFSPSRSHISEYVLKHQCVGRQRTEELMSSPSLIALFPFCILIRIFGKMHGS
ncbi:hypothetical protein M5K25_009082 [Dendrobium thyrsiflorum]|uniref:Uncharacterized protein n=1 Tax=Dendrobium thyrsiflorum TaxID=117978 RepID=A0ABD0VBI9_DENTH